jgi:hypothetical protein
MNRLQELSLQDPTQLKTLATQTSQDLKSSATRTPDPGSAGLTDLAARFADVARTGDPTALMRFPSAAPGGSSQAAVSALSAEIDAAFNLKPPPLGPWFPK